MINPPADPGNYYQGRPTRGDRLTGWFHDRGCPRSRDGAGRRLVGTASWAVWMSLFVTRHRMSAGNRIGALVRLWLWQVWRRLGRRPIVVEIPGGLRLLCPPWSRLASALASVGLHEPEETFFVADLLRLGDQMIDVGANLGVYSLVAARHGASVLAFEPGRRVRALLAYNARLNGLESRISVQAAALADFTGRAVFTEGLDVDDHLVLGQTSTLDGAAIEVTTIDEFLDGQDGGCGPLLLKIDAEGADQSVLAGATRLIEESKPVVIVEIWEGGNQIRMWLEARGYRVYRYQVASRELAEIPTSFQGQANFIAVHSERLPDVRSRLASATRPAIRPPRIEWRVGGPPIAVGDQGL